MLPEISKLILESGLISYAILNEELAIIECNKSFVKIIGSESDKIKNKNFKDFISENDLEKFVDFIQNSVSIKTPSTIRLKVVTKNKLVPILLTAINCIDSQKWYLIHALEEKFSDYDKSNVVSYEESSNELLSKIEHLNKVLEEQRCEYNKLNSKIINSEFINNQIINSLNDGIWVWEILSNQITISDRFFNILDYESYELPQHFNTIRELIHPDDLPLILQALNDLKNKLTTSTELECRMRKKNGDYIWTLLRASIIEANDMNIPLQLIATHIDIDKRKKLEIKLKENEEELLKKNAETQKINIRLEQTLKENEHLIKELKENQVYLNSILKAVPAAIALISNRNIIFVNDYACFMMGYDKEEVIGKEIRFLFENDDEYTRVLSLLAKDNQASSTEIQSKSVVTRWKMKNGTLIDVYVTATYIDTELFPNSYTVAAVDITSQRIYEEELLKAKEDAERAEMLKTRFLCNISHELRTPANGIIGFAELLQKQDNPAKREQYLKIIINSSKQLVKTISDLIDISKIETGEIEISENEIDVSKLFHDLYTHYYQTLISRGKVDVEIVPVVGLPEKYWHILTDENKLKQILHNLLNNAVKFTDKGYIRFGISKNQNELEFFVSDTGIGIDESELETVFESFRKTDLPTRKLYGGNGLGLAISKGFVEAMGGRIWIKSTKNIGTTVFFTIPLKVVHGKQLIKNDMQKNWNEFKLLVVEDDIITVELIRNILIETGIEITHASTGLEALKLIRRNYKPDIILMDMRLPEMDGYETTRRIKEIYSNVPIIAQTAHALTEDRNKCLAAGCDEYITKPFTEEAILKIISHFIEKNS